MIDEKKLIAEIREYIDEYKELDMQGVHNLKWCAMMEALELVERQPKIKQPNTDGWIRLPLEPPLTDVEVIIKDNKRGTGYYAGGAWWDSTSGFAIDVVAWKEPSEPWGGEK